MSIDVRSGRSSLVLTQEEVRHIVREEIERALKRDPAAKRACIIASKGTLDWAYPPLILGSAAAAAGMDAAIFFTFYGLNIIHKDFRRRLKVSPVGNPAMPMPMPMADTFTSLPGMKGFATWMLKDKFRRKGVAAIEELLGVCRESGVRLIACALTIEVFGFKESDFLEGVEFGGAGAFMSQARRSHVTLLV
jgi:peroxiredoxin family protein